MFDAAYETDLLSEEGVVYTFKGNQAEIEIRDQEELTNLVRALKGRGYSPMFLSMGEAAVSVLGGVSPVSVHNLTGLRYYGLGEAVLGEFLTKGDSLFILLPHRPVLIVFEIRHHTCPELLTALCTDIQESISQTFDGRRVRGMKFSWTSPLEVLARRSARARRRPRAELTLGTRPVAYSDADLRGSFLLSNDQHRQFILELAKLGKLRASDAQLSGSILDQLQAAELIVREYLVTCRKDSHTICTVPDKDRLERELGPHLKCPVCNRTFAEELISEIFSLSDFGRKLLNGSHWMTVWITHLLEESGLDQDMIKWNAQGAEDEIDIVVEVPRFRVSILALFTIRRRGGRTRCHVALPPATGLPASR